VALSRRDFLRGAAGVASVGVASLVAGRYVLGQCARVVERVRPPVSPGFYEAALLDRAITDFYSRALGHEAVLSVDREIMGTVEWEEARG